MRLADVVGHAGAVARLRRAAAAGRIPSAVLLLGPPGVGKGALASAFTARLLCDAPTSDDACGACAQCTRVAAGTHPDVRVVVRDAERRDIRTEQVRELSRWLALQPLMGARKIAILDGAEHLNEHGQNALLKTLEEPPGRSVLLLIASASAGLLPTVRSRCQILRLQPLDREAVRRVLAAAGLPPERAERLAPLAEGCPGRALALEGEEVAKAREVILGAVPRLDRFGAVELSALAQELARGPVEAALRALLAWYRDALETALLGDQARVRNADALAALRAAAVRLPAQARLRQLEAVCDTIEALGRNANRMLALETMLLTLREIERGSAKATAG